MVQYRRQSDTSGGADMNKFIFKTRLFELQKHLTVFKEQQIVTVDTQTVSFP